MKSRLTSSVSLFALALSFVSLSLTASIARADADADFAKLKKVVSGKWVFSEKDQTGAVKDYLSSFEPVSHGAALMERNEGYVAMYHLDGDSILMTLYTKDGNQPRLRSKGFNAETSSFDFEFVDATNLPQGAPHISGLSILIRDFNTMVEKWSFTANGQVVSFEFELVRVLTPM